MLNRLRKALRPSADDRLQSRKTTEVTVDDSGEQVERARAHEPALIMLEGDLAGEVFRVRAGRQIIGRRPECDIRVRERAVSGIHAEVIRVRDTVTINDLASTNGTLVNGARIRTPVVLNPGTLVRTGNCVFRFVDSLLEVEFTEAMHTRGVTDELTSAFNKRYLHTRLKFILDLASETRPVSIVTFDYDGFKSVNDAHGHAVGDEALRLSTRLIARDFVRDGHVFARMGGEEFAIVLPDTPLPVAADLAERLRRTLAETTFDCNGVPVQLQSSFGVCTALDPFEEPTTFLARADAMLYRSKREGRNRVTAG